MDTHNKKENELRQRKLEVGDTVFVYLSGPGCWNYSTVLERKKLPKNYGYIYKVIHEGYSMGSEDTEWKYYSYVFYTGGSHIKGIGEPFWSTCFRETEDDKKCFGRTVKVLLNQKGDYEYKCEKCGKEKKENAIENNEKFLRNFEEENKLRRKNAVQAKRRREKVRQENRVA